MEWSLLHYQWIIGPGVHLFEAHNPCLLPYNAQQKFNEDELLSTQI